MSLALIDSGIQTSDTLTAVGVALLSATDSDTAELDRICPQSQRLQVGSTAVVIDPTQTVLQSELYRGEATFAWDQQERLIISWYKHNQIGHRSSRSDMKFDADDKLAPSALFFKSMNAAKQAWKQVSVFKRQAVTRKLLFEASVSATDSAQSQARQIEDEVAAEKDDDEMVE